MKTTLLRRLVIGLTLMLPIVYVNAQNGLEQVIVEKYYVSNSADATTSIGVLPVGSVTYRIYADLLPGYTFQAAYGNATHTLFINSTTSFFNNEDRGNTTPTYTKTQAKNNTVMLDSWLSAGAACSGNFGILKSEDNSVATIVNADGILANADPSAGIPLTTQDGIITVAGRTPGSVGTIGIDTPVSILNATSQVGNSFSTSNGSWYCLGGAVGPDSTINKVLIAQITTDGVLSFELNIQIGTPVAGVSEYYVANNPAMYNGQMELSIPSLTYNSTTVSVENTSVLSPEIKIFPNPAKDILTLDINNLDLNASNYYTIYDMIGRVLLTKKIQSSSVNSIENIDISSLARGMYVMEVSLNETKSSRKIIKN
jgi:hypothetical protein